VFAQAGLGPRGLDVGTLLTVIDQVRRVMLESTGRLAAPKDDEPQTTREQLRRAIRAANELTRNETRLDQTLYGPRTRRAPHNRPTAPPKEMARPLPDKLSEIDTLVLDPGHGGDNTGGAGTAGVVEKKLTLQLAYELRFRLQRQFPQLRVVMTRYTDREIPLEERTHLANKVDADLFLSLHYNAASHNRAVGFETYFLETRQVVPGRPTKPGEPIAAAASSVTGVPRPPDNADFGIAGDTLPAIRRDLHRARNHRLSGLLAEAVQKRMVANIMSIDRGVKQANFGVLRGAMMPAVVVEGGFMTHPGEGHRILYDSHRERMARALTEAVVRFDDQLTGTDRTTQQ
jgi:N-acetylmuramoyl-L-alanine amidase